MSRLMSEKIKVAELFAGVGGFRLGLEKASDLFDVVWANQWEPATKVQHAFNCYTYHFGENSKHSNEDIASAKSDIPNHDLLVGGFPCQDYSVARTGANGIEGKKGVLWWSINDIIKAKKPRFVLLENVDRLIKSPAKQRGRDFGIMLRCFYDNGYNVEWRVINAADYGLAQRRRRVFIFAYRNIENKARELEKFTKTGFFANLFPITGLDDKKQETKININSKQYSDLATISESFSAKFYNSGAMIDGEIHSVEIIPKATKGVVLADLVEKDSVGEKYFVNGSLEKFQYLKGSKRIPRTKPNGEPYIYSEGAMAFPDPMDRPARTMLTSESSVNRSTHVITDPKTGQYRLLTPLECERINGFEDNWTNTGMPEKMRYFCMGNALVVPLVEQMGKGIVSLWE